jgi:preprotein translocase subunit SecY
MPDLSTRIAVTLGVLAVYRLGTYLPLPGIDAVALAQMTRGSPLGQVRAAVFALGILPLVSILLLVEVARLASSRFNGWAGATPTNARRVDHGVLIGALLLATWQSYGIAIALERVEGLVEEPGLQFRLMLVSTFVASTALLAWLASLISRYGLGSGVWVLFLAPQIADLPVFAVGVLELVREGVVSIGGLIAVLAGIFIAVAALIAVARPLILSRVPLDRALIWPLLIAAVPAGMLALVPQLLPDGSTRDTVASLLKPGAPVFLAVLAVLVIAVALAQWRAAAVPTVAELSEPVEPGGASPRLLTALLLAAVAVVPQVLTTRFGMPILIDGRLIVVIVSVALAAQVLGRR